MELRIIKPINKTGRTGKMSVTLTTNGYLSFNIIAVSELDISENKGILLACDENGDVYLKVCDATMPDTFQVRVRKNGAYLFTYIPIMPTLQKLGITVHKSIRCTLVKSEQDFYKIEGLADSEELTTIETLIR